jgi:hypothetical protein
MRVSDRLWQAILFTLITVIVFGYDRHSSSFVGQGDNGDVPYTTEIQTSPGTFPSFAFTYTTSSVGAWRGRYVCYRAITRGLRNAPLGSKASSDCLNSSFNVLNHLGHGGQPSKVLVWHL